MAGLQQEVFRLCNLSDSSPGNLLSQVPSSDPLLRKTHPAVYVIAVVLGCISLALSVACLIFNALSRNNRVVKMSSPRLNVVIACGGILASCVCMLVASDYFLDTSSGIGHSVCQARAALLAVSFTLVFGPMVGKTWRVNQIFRLAGAKRVIIKDVRLVAFTTILLCVDIIWTLLWNFLDPLDFTSILIFEKGEAFAESLDIISTESSVLVLSRATNALVTVAGCACEWGALWAAGLLLYKAPFLVWGLREAWWTRGHILPATNDSACLAFSSITTGVAMLVYAVTSEAFRKWPTVVDACALASIWISVMVSIGFVFIPKVRVWRSTPKGERCRVSISSISNSMAFLQSFENIESELTNAHSEIDSLKSFIKQKESDMDTLQGLLSNAENSLAHIQLGHADLDAPRGSPNSSGDREKRNRKLKSDKLKGADRHDNGGDDLEEVESPHWSGPDCGQSSSADEGGVTSEEVNSSLDNSGPGLETDQGHSCCLHGKACQAGGDRDNEKEEGSCWYLPSDRGYAPAHLLASNRGRHHHRHHHHHRRRRRPGMSAPAGHSFNRGRRTVSASTPTGHSHGHVGHRAASSCGSSSVFTKGSSSNKNPTLNNSNVYVHYAKRGGGVPARRHSHGSIYTQQLCQQQQHQQQQQGREPPQRLFDYSPFPERNQYDGDHARYFSLDRRQLEYTQSQGQGITSHPNYPCDAEEFSKVSLHHTESDPRHAGPSRPRFSIPKHRKRRRSSTPSVQSSSSYIKLSKLRSELSDAMAISRRLMGAWSVDSAPVGGSHQGPSPQPHHFSATVEGHAKRGRPKSADKSRRQTVIGIQGIADSILESYNFQRTEDNHSFVYDCITPRRYATSTAKIGKSSTYSSSKVEYKDRNDIDNNPDVFSFNFHPGQNQRVTDIQTLESGLQHSRIELASFGFDDKKINGVENSNPTNSQIQCIPNNSYPPFANNINHPPSATHGPNQGRIYSSSGEQYDSNFYGTPMGRSPLQGYSCNNNNMYEKDMSAFCHIDNGYNDYPNNIGPEPMERKKSDSGSLVFLPPRNVSIQSMVNQAHFDDTVPKGGHTHSANNIVNHTDRLPVSAGENEGLRRSPGLVTQIAGVETRPRSNLSLQHLVPPRNREETNSDRQKRSPASSLHSEVCIRNAQREETHRHSPYQADSAQVLSADGLFNYPVASQDGITMRRNDSFA